MSTQISIDKDICRICLTSKKPLCHLFKYKLSGNYAEMLTSIADVKVASNDGLPDKICNKCCIALEKAFCLKTVSERSDRKLRKIIADRSTKIATKKIAFDSFKDIKSEITPLQVKNEPKWELEIEMSNNNSAALKPIETIDGKDIVIANTIIKKVDKCAKTKAKDKANDTVDLTANEDDTNKNDDIDAEYLDDDVFQDDDKDEDYVPPVEKSHKFKKPRLTEVKVYNEKKTIVRKIKVLKKLRDESKEGSNKTNKYRVDGLSKATMITCYPIMKNGTRGPPILLKRPKDATVLKIHPNYKSNGSYEGTKVIQREKPLRIVRNVKASQKQKEKLVCPVCGILTFTLGNHMATHDEKKRYNCTECSKTFSQKGNLLAHLKHHSGVKDHICEICGAGFYNQKSLVRHNLIHKGERPFPCNLCCKKFIARCDLNRHLRIHSGYKPYKCDVCAMSFNAKHQLQNHERMHTGERPYTCQVCNVAFSYKVNLNNHVFKVHGINLKFKSIHTVTEEVLRKELGIANEAQEAISHIVPHIRESGWGRQSPPPDARDTKSPMNDYRIS